MSFFQKLYEGKYAPIHEEVIHTEEYKELRKEMVEKEKAFRGTLSEEQMKLFERYQETQLECDYHHHLQSFRQGFEIGVEFHKEYRKDDLPIEG